MRGVYSLFEALHVERGGCAMEPDELRRELERLSRRLDRIEERLGLPPASPDGGADGVECEPASSASPLPATEQASVSSGDFAEDLAPSGAPVEARVEIAPTESPAGAAAAPGPSITSAGDDAYDAAVVDQRAALEFRIGGRWTAWAGAIVVVIAVGFFVKLAVDEGWFGRLSPLVKCLLSAGLGALLVGAGEWALRKIGRPAAVGLFGAGLGTFYLTSFATFRYFNLLSEGGAFVLLGLTALFGFALTVRTRMLTIGVLSVIGGCLAPVLLSGAATFVAALPIYLTALLTIALALSAWRGDPFRAVRYVAFGGQALIGLLWAADEGRAHVVVALVFLSLWWVMIAAEAVLAARRDESATGNVVLSLLSTLWYVTLGCWILAGESAASRDVSGVFTAVIAVIAGVGAFRIGGGFAALRATAPSATFKLAIAFWAQCGVLLTVAIALRFEQFGQTIGWLALALAAVESGRRIGSQGVSIFGLLVGIPALLRVITLDWESKVLATVLWSPGDVAITYWALLAVAAIAVMHTAARRIQLATEPAAGTIPILLSSLSVIGWLGVCLVQCERLAITGGWLVAVAPLLALERFGRRQRYLEAALLLLAVTAARWLIYDAALDRLRPDWDPRSAWPVLNGRMALAALLAMATWWATRVLRARDASEAELDAPPRTAGWRIGWQTALLGGALLLLIGLSLEIDRAVERIAALREVRWSLWHVRQLLWTMLWSAGGLTIGMLARFFSRHRDASGKPAPWLWRFAWALLVACALKWVVVDSLSVALDVGGDAARCALRAWPLVNLQVLAGAGVIGALLILFSISGAALAVRAPADERPRSVWLEAAAWLPVAAALLVLWGLTLEVDRAIGRWELGRAADVPALWPPLHLRMLWWIVLWAAGGWVMDWIGRRRGCAPLSRAGWVVLCGAAGCWLLIDTLAWRVARGVVLAPMVFNLQFAVGAALAVLLGLAWRLSRAESLDNRDAAAPTWARPTALTLLGAIGLWLGTFELDRFCAPEAGRFASAAMVRHTAFSIYWGSYAIALVALGFRWRAKWARYAGLALLTITLAKVLIIDMAEVRYAYRVLSLLGVGLLLVGTSVAYGKLAPRLLRRDS